MDEGSLDGEFDGLFVGAFDSSFVGTKLGKMDGIRVGWRLMDGGLVGFGEGNGESVGTSGPKEGCPVPVGEFNGTKDNLG